MSPSAVATHIRWIEDEIAYDDEYSYLRGLSTATGNPFFAVRPSLEDGLTEAHMIRIRNFIRKTAAPDQFLGSSPCVEVGHDPG